MIDFLKEFLNESLNQKIKVSLNDFVKRMLAATKYLDDPKIQQIENKLIENLNAFIELNNELDNAGQQHCYQLNLITYAASLIAFSLVGLHMNDEANEFVFQKIKELALETYNKNKHKISFIKVN